MDFANSCSRLDTCLLWSKSKLRAGGSDCAEVTAHPQAARICDIDRPST